MVEHIYPQFHVETRKSGNLYINTIFQNNRDLEIFSQKSICSIYCASTCHIIIIKKRSLNPKKSQILVKIKLLLKFWHLNIQARGARVIFFENCFQTVHISFLFVKKNSEGWNGWKPNFTHLSWSKGYKSQYQAI